MGWSCTYEAGRTMGKVLNLCNDNGLIETNEGVFFVDLPSLAGDYDRIPMDVFKRVSGNAYKRVGRFYVMPDGSISKSALRRFPFLKKALEEG